MDLYESCKKITEKIVSGDASEYHLEQFVLNLLDGETPAMSVAMALDDSDNDNIIGDKSIDADEWAN